MPDNQIGGGNMSSYQELNGKTEEVRRTLRRLIELRSSLQKEIPMRTLNETLLLATWNIRDFDKPAYGNRLDESFYYIAEIISHFDLVAIQEVYKDLTALNRVVTILGPAWKCVFSDETMGDQGNDERLAFVYDSRKVEFGGLAGEIVLPPIQNDEGNWHPVSQLFRTPMIIGFRSGWCSFMLATVHILWGDNKEDNPQRIREIREVAQFLKKRTEDDTAWARNLILLGDFNIFGNDDETFKQITNAGFEVPDELLDFRTNAKQTRRYDQIAFRTRSKKMEITDNAGVFNYYETVFRSTIEDRDLYAPYIQKTVVESNRSKPPSRRSKEYNDRTEAKKTSYYRTYWRTHQMSDHLPMWVELRIDYSDEYLKSRLN
jgi:endonuclease/exonuclease/phosphatase family metal-dependent hydrolase